MIRVHRQTVPPKGGFETLRKTFRISRFAGLTVFCVFLVLAWPAGPGLHADISLDGTMGTSGSLTGPDYRITSDLGQQVGGNLFHSFDTFDVATGETATFTGPDTTENIIGRVTGGTGSRIDGRIISDISDANLYLINPAGIIFGENASLDIGGSFHATTADYLSLDDGGRFDASRTDNTILTSASPAAFGFLSDTPAGISIRQGILQVGEGESVSLVCGDISNTSGTIYAPGGRINLVSVASPGEVTLDGDDSPSANGFDSLGSMTLVSDGSVDIDGTEIGTLDVSGATGGAIYIIGGNLTVEGGMIRSDTVGGDDSEASNSASGGSGGNRDITIDLAGDLAVTDATITVSTYGEADSGNLWMTASDVQLDNASLFARSYSGATGDGGSITVEATGELALTNGTRISVSTLGTGDAGDLTLNARDISLTDSELIAQTHADASGSGGDLTVEASEAFKMSDSSSIEVSTHGAGDAGSIRITAAEMAMDGAILLARAYSGSTGTGGDVAIETTGTFQMTNGARISLSTLGEGDAGDFLLDAADVLLSDSDIIAQSHGGSSGNSGDVLVEVSGTIEVLDDSTIEVSTYGDGDAGSIRISAEDILTDGSFLLARAYAGSTGTGGDVTLDAAGAVQMVNGTRISLAALGEGDAGDFALTAAEVLLSDSDISARSIGDALGDGGDISLTASGTITITDSAAIASNSDSRGSAGHITVQASAIRIDGDSSISCETTRSDGGDISIVAADILHLIDSGITTSVDWDTGDGGNITIDPVFVILDNSRVIANAYEGDGGNIFIETDYFFPDASSQIEASSETGIDGAVHIETPGIDLSTNLTSLPEYATLNELVDETCASRDASAESSLLIRGKGSTRPGPDDLLF